MSTPTVAQRGYYLVFEGGDGCGKTSQASQLVQWLQQRGRAVLHVREPGSTPVGEAIRRLLLAPETGELDLWTEALLFSAARRELLHRSIEPALRSGAVVVAERSYLSMLVYQGLAREHGLPLTELQQLTDWVHGANRPSRVVLLDLPAEQARARRAGRGEDRFEQRSLSWHEAVRHGFLTLAAADTKIEVVDATADVDSIQSLLRQKLAQWGWL